MVRSAHFIVSGKETPCGISLDNPRKAAFEFSPDSLKRKSFDIKIGFNKPVTFFRNHDHTWIHAYKNFTAGPFVPKILKLESGAIVQANINHGIWEWEGNYLLWRFNPPGAHPLTVYTGALNQRIIAEADHAIDFVQPPALLFVDSGIEFSRSAIPFSAIACFTDHCDFDTPESLVLQRQMFKRHSIRTTKGFFLNHYSKRADNASMERDEDELLKWRDDGQELAYHSLSQSIKDDNESLRDFFSFDPPKNIPTWIDHGYQPYNLSLYHRYIADDGKYAENLASKCIRNMWNYVDSGTAVTGVINQLNPGHFTLGKFYAAHRNTPPGYRIGRMIKNIMFHFFADEKLITAYSQTSASFKNAVEKKSVKSLVSFFKYALTIAGPLSRIGIFWRKYSKKVYPLARYSPVMFRHRIAGKEFRIFQTIDMVNFRQALSPENISLLIKEKGLFIAHTYFSVPYSYHPGRMFATPHSIDAEVESNFENLGKLIRNGEIWNPTLYELLQKLEAFERVLLDATPSGEIIVTEGAGLISRTTD